MKKTIIISVLLVLCALWVSAQKIQYHRVCVNTTPNAINQIAALGIAPEGYFTPNGFVCELSERELGKLQAAGYAYTVLIEDVSTFYRMQNENPMNIKTTACGELPYATPAGFSLGSMGGFYTYDELIAKLDSLYNHYPQLISSKQAVDTFNTVEGRPVFWMRMSNQPNITQNKPKVLYTALTHAREPASMQQLVFYMCYLAENYGLNADVTNILNNYELYFIPCVNPDGYIYNEITDPMGGGLWRKNRSVNGGGEFGVDLNRNFGYNWAYDNQGSSPNPGDDTYRGLAAFSEPESRLVKSFCQQFPFKIVLNCHTYSNFLLYPWSYHQQMQTPDSLVFKHLGSILTAENKYTYGTGYGVLGYLANGDCIDWMYGDTVSKPRLIAFTPEIGSPAYGFWPPANQIENICKNTMHQNLYAAFLSGKFALLTDRAPLIVSAYQGYIPFEIQNAGLDSNATFTVSLQALSANIQSVGTPLSFTGMGFREVRTDSLFFTLNGSTQPGDTLKFLLVTNNGVFNKTDTVVKIFGLPVVVFADSCTNLNNWTTTGWGISTTQYWSAPASITDSPNGSYQTNSTKTIMLQQSVSLSNALHARLTFRTLFDIATGYDYVQLRISTDNGTTWTPLCGQYTIVSGNSLIENEPAYEGRSNIWVEENIDLSSYINQNVKFRFVLKSDWYPWTKPDGFYFDDFKVSIIDTTQIISGQLQNQAGEQALIYPNPTGNSFTIECSDLAWSLTGISVYNTAGQCVYSAKEPRNPYTINAVRWPSGIYTIKIQSSYGTMYQRLIKINEF